MPSFSHAGIGQGILAVVVVIVGNVAIVVVFVREDEHADLAAAALVGDAFEHPQDALARLFDVVEDMSR